MKKKYTEMLLRKSGGKGLFERTKCRWEDNIKGQLKKELGTESHRS
jgi:hypothetical protein